MSRRSRFLPTAPTFNAAVRGRGFPSEYRHAVWYGKTRMALMKKRLKIRLFVLTQYTNVTDGQTDTISTDTTWRLRPRLMLASRGKMQLPAHCPNSLLLSKITNLETAIVLPQCNLNVYKRLFVNWCCNIRL